MPTSTRAMHPSGTLGITFTEQGHSYIDDFNCDYISATALVHQAFPAFDAAAAAARKSARTGIPAETYVREWEEYGAARAALGTRTHENCERQILGKYAEMHRPEDEDERLRFRAAWGEVESLKRQYPHIEPEKLVFSPRFHVAGSIDLFCRIDNLNYALGDWKFVKELKFQAFGGAVGTHMATSGMPDCNFYHYALQLNVYELILKLEGYIPLAARVRKFLKKYCFETRNFQHVNVPDFQLEAFMLIAWNSTSDGLEYVPF